jgi:tetratricopeptide (TPR) repeat protein
MNTGTPRNLRLAAALLLPALALALAGCPKGGGRSSGNQDPEDPRAAYQAGVEIIEEGRAGGKIAYKKAFKQFKAACDIGEEFDKPHAQGCYNAGVAAARLSRYDDAVDLYQRALTADPGISAAVQNLTVALLSAGKATEALPIYESYLKANPDDGDMVNNYAGALGEAGRYDEGVRVIQELLFDNAQDTRAQKTLARIYFLAKRYRMSQMASANALKMDEADADIHNNLGLTWLKEDNQEAAVLEFKKAVELDPDNLEANMNLGLIAVRAADYQLAAESFQKVLKDNPGQTEALIGMGIAYRGILEMDSAIAQYDSILAVNSCQETALLNKGIVQHLFLKKYAEAKKTYSALQECNQGDRSIADRLAKVDADIAEETRAAAELAEIERQFAELEEKAKVRAKSLIAEMARAERVFLKYKGVEQHPSWAEYFVGQLEAAQFALESEDFFFMEEQGQYLDDFMVEYYQGALLDEDGKPIVSPDEWTAGAPIDIPEPAPEEAEATEAGGDAAAGDTPTASGAAATGEVEAGNNAGAEESN